MKLLVTAKQVIDAYVRIRVKADHSGVETQQVKMAMNPFDEIALEAAIRLKEQGLASDIVLLSIGTISAEETLRHGLALGADRAILVRTDKAYCSLNIAKIIQKIVQQEAPDLVLMGKQAIDGDNNQTPQMLAGLLDWPQITFVSALELRDKVLHCKREVDAGLESVETTLPAIVSVDLRLNEPRYATLPHIMKAKQKPLAHIDWQSLGVTLKEHCAILKVTPPPPRGGGIILDSVTALLDTLQHVEGVLPG